MRLVTFSDNSDVSRRVGVLVPLSAAQGAHTFVVDLVAAFAADGKGPPLTGGVNPFAA